MPDGLVLEMPYWSFGGLNTFVFDADMLKVVEIVLNDENRYCEYLGKEKCLKHTQKFNSDSSEWFVVPKMPDRRSEVKSNCIFHFGKLYPASGRIRAHPESCRFGGDRSVCPKKIDRQRQHPCEKAVLFSPLGS